MLYRTKVEISGMLNVRVKMFGGDMNSLFQFVRKQAEDQVGAMKDLKFSHERIISYEPSALDGPEYEVHMDVKGTIYGTADSSSEEEALSYAEGNADNIGEVFCADILSSEAEAA